MLRAAFILFGCCIASVLAAQNEIDALRITSSTPGGTARSNGMANAFGALGADPVSIGINPAGFALYTGSGFSLTTLLEVNNSSTNHYGSTATNTDTRFAANNIALIIRPTSNDNSSGWTTTYGVIYDRKQSQHWNTTAQSPSVQSSILQSFVDQAQGTDYHQIDSLLPFGAGLAWDAYAIDTIAGSTTNYVGFPFSSSVKQHQTIASTGATTQTSFFYSGNYNNKLYLGASLGITGHKFKRTSTHQENSLDPATDLQQVSYKETLSTTGKAFDLKLGAIYRVSDRIRTGLSFHSPQSLLLNDAWINAVSTRFSTPDNQGNYSYESTSPTGSFAYKLITPWRTVVSAAYLAGKNGTVSVDYEYADMRNMRFKDASSAAASYDFALENKAIKSRFVAQNTIRIGTEWRAGNMYYRGGWSMVPNAYAKSDPLHAGATKTYAAGIGYRGKHTTVDLGLNYAISGSAFYQYAAYLVNPTTETRASVRTFITFAWRP